MCLGGGYLHVQMDTRSNFAVIHPSARAVGTVIRIQVKFYSSSIVTSVLDGGEQCSDTVGFSPLHPVKSDTCPQFEVI